MRRAAAFLALTATSVAQAHGASSGSSWAPPRETSIAQMHEEQVALGWSPRPTEAPKALMGRMLMPRMDEYTLGPRTCGFVSSDGASFTCISDQLTCTSSSSHVGCCELNKECNIIKTKCLDYDASSAGRCNLPDDFHTLCCSVPSRGACYTWLMSTTGKDDRADNTFTLLDCASADGTGILLDYDPAWAATHVFQSKSSSSSARETDSTSTGPADKDDGDKEKDDGGGDGTNVGAIAGGAAGGAVGLAIIGAIIFFCLRRKKKQEQMAGNASPAQPMAQNPPAPQPNTFQPSSPGAYSSGVPAGFQGYPPHAQPGQQGYDPHASMYSQQGYSPQSQYPPQQFQGFYNPNQPGFQQNFPAGYIPPPSASPPPLTTPSPIASQASPSPAIKDGGPVQTSVNELQAVNPVGHESNRAELGPR